MDLWVFDRTSGNSIQLTSTPEAERNPDWSPDGDRITFSRRIESSHVFFGDPLTRESHQITTGQARDMYPVISPDGKWVAFVRRPKLTQGEASKLVLCIAPVEGEGVQYIRLGGLALQDGRASIAWSPDSDHIAFTADDGTGNVDIYRVARSDGNPERVTIAPGQDGFPSWSPDGHHLAYMRFADGATNIWAIPSSGGLAMQLTKEGLNQGIAWAPDSDHIAYAWIQGEGEDPELWLTSLSRPGDARMILEKSSGNYPEAWSRDGKVILVWNNTGDNWSAFAYTLDGRRLFKVADEEPGESFVKFTEKGKKYAERIYEGGLHAFTDGDNISNIYVMRVPEIIEAKLQAGGDWK
jgi:Tol biopolymer transport system component